MEQTKNGESTPQTGTDVKNTTSSEQGRMPGSPQEAPVADSDDISEIDQQEGQMNNGVLGGNFGEAGTSDGSK